MGICLKNGGFLGFRGVLWGFSELFRANVAVFCGSCYHGLMAEKETDSYDELVDQVIEAYRKLLNQGMALDVCRVQGKMRSMILRDARFIRETKAIRAEKYMRELEEIEDIYSAASRLGDDSSGYDSSGRDGSPGKGRSSDKDALSMQLKAAAMRRELTALTADDMGDNEESAVNFFFTALTAEEMEMMKQVEVNRGTSGDGDAFKSIGGENEADVAVQAKKRKQMARTSGGDDGGDDDDPFEVMPDGTLRARR